MPMFLKNMPSMRQLRTLSTRLEQGQHTSSAILKANPRVRAWPAREDSFAAAQILLQKQPIRSLSNNQLDTGMFRPVTMPGQARVQALPSRNTVVAAQNAARRRATRHLDDNEFEYRDRQRGGRMDEIMEANRENEERMEAESELEAQQEREMERSRSEMMDENHDYESDLEVRSVREAVFGLPEDNVEEEELRAKADQELLRQVITTNRYEPPVRGISQKVISPYNSYRSHRTRWAEFRHCMIYGRTSF